MYKSFTPSPAFAMENLGRYSSQPPIKVNTDFGKKVQLSEECKEKRENSNICKEDEKHAISN